jgi:hypothetical protein
MVINMLHNLFSNIIAIIEGVFAGEIINNRLNPLRLAIATTGYRIQSRTLYIPDRIGFFSSGPPRLQVHEATCFIVLVMASCFTIVSGGFLVFLLRLWAMPNLLKLSAAILSWTVAQAVIMWITACYDRRRTPGYDWKDWKLRKD